jgi:hypothetical protein
MTPPRLAVALSDALPDAVDLSAAHRLLKQSSPETKVPGRANPKFVDFSGTKSRRGPGIGIANIAG